MEGESLQQAERPRQKIYFNMEEATEQDLVRALETKPSKRSGLQTELYWINQHYDDWADRLYWYNGDNLFEDGYNEMGEI